MKIILTNRAQPIDLTKDTITGQGSHRAGKNLPIRSRVTPKYGPRNEYSNQLIQGTTNFLGRCPHLQIDFVCGPQYSDL